MPGLITEKIPACIENLLAGSADYTKNFSFPACGLAFGKASCYFCSNSIL
jgi:hypothetical protein